MWKQSIWMPPHQSAGNRLINWLKKNDCLRQKYGNFKLKTGRACGSWWKYFRENGCYNCKTNERTPTKKLSHVKKINDILFEIELFDYKQQQSHPINEHFRGPINTSNNSIMISQNPYSIAQAPYAKTSFPVS